MATHSSSSVKLPFYLLLLLLSSMASSPALAQLSVSFYATTCPSVFDTVRASVRSAVSREPRMGASLIRLFFHDCFAGGCDGSILLDGADGEKTAAPNVNSVRGYEVIDAIKARLSTACGGNVVSCADIVAIAARDSVVELGGPSYGVPVGRRDSTTSNKDGAERDLPGFFENLDAIIAKFARKGFTAREMVALSGAHTVGQAQCATFRDRIYNETNIDPTFASMRQANCPRSSGQGDGNLAPLDSQSPNRFGNNYFQELTNRRGLLHSDQVLFNGGSTDSIVTLYSSNPTAFATDFANAMAKMGNLGVLTGAQGQIRVDCKRVN
ncbi:peroxidase P7-like [Nymphaea colorata]|nr:peroxidase P7-like [Nymphaea colorata]